MVISRFSRQQQYVERGTLIGMGTACRARIPHMAAEFFSRKGTACRAPTASRSTKHLCNSDVPM